MREIGDFLRKHLGLLYLRLGRKIWWRLPAALTHFPPVRWYGFHLHAMVQWLDDRSQNHSTFFFRNRPELELMRRLLELVTHGSRVAISVLACSKGAEVYSIASAIRSARSDLRITLNAIDIAQDVVDFAKKGVYSLATSDVPHADRTVAADDALILATNQDQGAGSIFARITEREMAAMFDREGDLAKVKAGLKEGIVWRCGNAQDPALASLLGPQDIVVANRFLCHMKPASAERCLRSIARLVKPGGYLFVSGVDLDVRTKVARDMGWRPVTDLIREVHEGDWSLRDGWPLQYWALEPFEAKRRDGMTRYASVFQLPEFGRHFDGDRGSDPQAVEPAGQR
jgi:chemotaxis methyl-accepting protein methylase